MPYINVKLAGNLNKDQKKEIAKEMTDLMQRVASKPASYTYIVFEEIKSVRKIKDVPNFWKYLANSPDTLERTWNSTSQVMKPGALDAVTKELIYVAVSMTNSCEYCTKSHTFAAKKKGATEEMIKEMIDVMGIANQNNKLVEAYGVEVDEIYK